MTGPDGHPDSPPRDLDGAPGNALPPHSSQCMGCGPDNSAGLAMQVRREGDDVVCEQTFDARQVGAPGLVHGGAVAAACDDLFGFVLTIHQIGAAFTGELTVRYLAGTPLFEPLEFRARLVGEERRKLFMAAEARAGDLLIATATATFIRLPDV